MKRGWPTGPWGRPDETFVWCKNRDLLARPKVGLTIRFDLETAFGANFHLFPCYLLDCHGPIEYGQCFPSLSIASRGADMDPQPIQTANHHCALENIRCCMTRARGLRVFAVVLDACEVVLLFASMISPGWELGQRMAADSHCFARVCKDGTSLVLHIGGSEAWRT